MLFRGHKPEWLYEALPYLYVASGVVTAALLSNVVGTISGLLLISAGVIIWKLRRDYRAKNRLPPATAPLAAESRRDANDTSDTNDAKLEPLHWHPSFEVGHDQIDRQHRRLFAIANDLGDALMSKKPKDDIALMIDELLTDIAHHFRSEGETLAADRMPLTDVHQDIHRSLLSCLTEMRDKFRIGQLPLGELSALLAYDAASQNFLDGSQPLFPAAQNG